MKIAVCISGALRTFSHCAPSIRSFFGEADYYGSFWSTEAKEVPPAAARSLLPFKMLDYTDQPSFPVSTEEPGTALTLHNPNARPMFLGMQRSFELLSQSVGSISDYDLIFRCRPDLWLRGSMVDLLPAMDAEKVYFPNHSQYRGYCDQFAGGPPHLMRHVFSSYQAIAGYEGKRATLNGERILKYWLDRHGVPVEELPFDFKIYRPVFVGMNYEEIPRKSVKYRGNPSQASVSAMQESGSGYDGRQPSGERADGAPTVAEGPASLFEDMTDGLTAEQPLRTRKIVLPYESLLAGPAEEIHDARIFGSDWVAVVPGRGAIINPSSATKRYSRQVSDTQYEIAYASPAVMRRYLKPVVVIGGHKNFYHHLIDYMSRLFTIERPRSRWYYALGEDVFPFHTHMRHFFEIPDERTIFVPADGIPIHCVRAVMPPPAAIRRGVVNMPAFRRMQEFGVAKVKSSAAKEKINLLISRKNARRRRLENEDELEKRLSKSGFLTVALENLAFIEQVRLFASAKTIVAPHGAGLASMIFAPPEAHIVEIVPQGGSPNFFINLSEACSMKLTRVEGSPGAGLREFVVDVQLVADALGV